MGQKTNLVKSLHTFAKGISKERTSGLTSGGNGEEAIKIILKSEIVSNKLVSVTKLSNTSFRYLTKFFLNKNSNNIPAHKVIKPNKGSIKSNPFGASMASPQDCVNQKGTCSLTNLYLKYRYTS